jgi:hypothetical protein
MELLSTAPIIERIGGPRVPAPRWDRLSCAANVVGGLDEWRLRLERHAARHRTWLERRAQQDGTLFAVDASDPVLDDCERLTAFVTDLAEQLRPPEEPTWRALSAWAVQLLERYVGRALPASAPDAEQIALERVRAAVEGLAGLDELARPRPPRCCGRRSRRNSMSASVTPAPSATVSWSHLSARCSAPSTTRSTSSG